MKLLYVCLEMSSGSKNYFGCVVRMGIYYEIALTLTLRKCSARPRRQWLQSESVTEFPLLSSYKRLESIRCSFRNVTLFQKIIFGFLVEEMSENGLTINSLCH